MAEHRLFESEEIGIFKSTLQSIPSFQEIGPNLSGEIGTDLLKENLFSNRNETTRLASFCKQQIGDPRLHS